VITSASFTRERSSAMPRSNAWASLSPTAAISGSENTTRGIAS